ncbi:FecR domain-containing protein [Pseudomonas typographi]|uniref:FecR family protein n=1 Tax=Pseudomonas typographi TaxID=2715964 RepID=A0ABR7Z2M4_9PSED|nr:FecR family protein [Pseudomonas typographi]MBD1553125.1 FecR family protein [Pseudomonas typographi]MBD1585888.1 FecR family protein [Pseudomonas typographi]MBD1599746.1 FecR family protein [Pseudomonas typographi]
MSTSRPNEALIDEAALWMVRLQSGEASPQELQAFADWRAGDARRAEVFDRMSMGAQAMRAGELRLIPRDNLLHTLNAPSGRRRFLGTSLGLGVGAIGLSLLARYVGWLPNPGYLSTGTDERRQLTLIDGSTLILNARSLVETRFDGNQRLLLLRRGELLVDVFKDAGRPFIVQTAEGRMRALGTRFLVRQEDDATRLVVLHSQVEIATAGGARQVVSAGQGARFDAGRILELAASDGTESAWTKGKLEVHDRPLGEVIESLRAYRRGIIRVAPEVAHLRLSGIYPLDDTDSTLQLLQRSLPIKVAYYSPYWVGIEPL